MAEPEASTGGNDQDLMTLSEVSKKIKVSMPTLQRYKKEYQDRIPAVGAGRKQRYPKSALEVFREIKKENAGKRGRPRKAAAEGEPAARARRGKRKPAAAARKVRGAAAKAPARRGPGRGRRASGGLLTLTEVSKRTGVSYPTLVRYVKLHGGEIPHEGTGRSRRYHPDAVAVFKRLRSESGRGGGRRAGGGRKAGGAGSARGGDAGLAKRLQALEREVHNLAKLLQRPLSVTLHRK
jgi:excisionase family DNA binding protein